MKAPAIIVCLTIVIGIVMNNRGIDAVNRRIDDLRSDLVARIESLDTRVGAIRSAAKRLVKRLERLGRTSVGRQEPQRPAA